MSDEIEQVDNQPDELLERLEKLEKTLESVMQNRDEIEGELNRVKKINLQMAAAGMEDKPAKIEPVIEDIAVDTLYKKLGLGGGK